MLWDRNIHKVKIIVSQAFLKVSLVNDAKLYF